MNRAWFMFLTPWTVLTPMSSWSCLAQSNWKLSTSAWINMYRRGASLAQTSIGFENTRHSSIDEWSYPRFTDVGFNPPDEGRVETKFPHDMEKKGMPKSVKCVNYINFYHHTLYTILKTWMDCLLNQNDVVPYFSSFNESSLVYWNDFTENAFYPSGHYFGDDFVTNIA